MTSFNRRKKSNKGTTFVVLVIIVSIIMFFFSDEIGIKADTTKPIVKTEYDVIYLGKNNIVNIDIYDDSTIKFYKIFLSDGKDAIDVEKSNVKNKKNLSLSIKLPKIELFFDKNNAFLNIIVVDNSYWNFGFGNKTVKKIKIIFDKNKPRVDIVKSSGGISRGGSALVVFGISDENIDKNSIYIQTNFGKKYRPSVFVKDGFYASLIAWPVYENKFFAYIIASDKAGNKIKKQIPIYKKRKFYKNSTIKLKNKFLNTTITSLYEELAQEDQAIDNAISDSISPVDRFKYLNEIRRARDEDIIESHTSSSFANTQALNSFEMYPFYPLKNSARVGSFGAFRKFTKSGQQVSTSYHLGLDVASVRRADIVSSNNAKVVFVGQLGLYGNSIILGHTFGLYTLYSHISRFLVYENDDIYAGKVIAKTGSTGLALGDHLHFGVIVQGIEVRPQEWMDKTWIKNNITDILADAKNSIIGGSISK